MLKAMVVAGVLPTMATVPVMRPFSLYEGFSSIVAATAVMCWRSLFGLT
jgi:hypothetical protein